MIKITKPAKKKLETFFWLPRDPKNRDDTLQKCTTSLTLIHSPPYYYMEMHYLIQTTALIWVCFRSQFCMDLINDLRERHLFNGSHENTCRVQFVFMDVLQRHLDECKEKWNTHTIRPVKQSRCPSGKPDVMYYLPHRFILINKKYFYIIYHIYFVTVLN